MKSIGWRIGKSRLALLFGGMVLALSTVMHSAMQSTTADYISGMVESSAGPEGGVWVIAETDDLPTHLIKIVVTDDDGRFVLPQLPDATYDVWVRGYGLADSDSVELRPGAEGVTLQAVVASTPQEAAQVYPGNYWMSLMEPPSPDMFPGTGEEGNGVGERMVSRENWVHSFKSSCNFCHQLGNALTRHLDHVFEPIPPLSTPLEAWEYRLRGGVRGGGMNGSANTMGRTSTLNMLVNWTTSISEGAVPEAPPRPDGQEQNVVLTLWDWGTDHSFMHDAVSTDKNNPTVNGYGHVYGVSAGHGTLVVLDPQANETWEIEIPLRSDRAEVPSRFPPPNPPSLHWGSEHLWSNPPYNPADPHNPMMDSKGRVWMTSKIRGREGPEWCQDEVNNAYAAWFGPVARGRQASYYDPATGDFQLLETCYGTHHLQFDNDENETLYFNELSGSLIGWVDTKVYDETLASTGDEIQAEQAAVGWCAQVLDTNRDGRITKPWNRLTGGVAATTLYEDGGSEAPEGFDPANDTLINYSLYSVIPSPVDNSAWGSAERFPGYVVRIDRGDNPPETCVAELYKVPEGGLDPRGIDIDTNGVVWAGLAGTAHLASFDRRKCNLEAATVNQILDGTSCAEGWTLYQAPGPSFTGTDIHTDFFYYNWTDQHNILGLGENIPMATGSNSDSLLALNPETGDWTQLRVPYPLGFYSRGMDGRIDDPNAGWKGRGLYAIYGTHFVWHIEGGKGTLGKLVKFQLRDTPLDR